MSRRFHRGTMLELLQEELSPYPGRTAGALRDTLGIVLAVVIAMTLQLPGFSLSAALLLLMQRERPGLTLRTGLQILAGCALAAIASLVWVQLTDGNEVARFLGVALCVFASAFCMVASTLPMLWTIFGFYGFVDLAYWDGHHSASAGVSYSLYQVASLALVLACATAVEYLFASRHPAEELNRELHRRLSSLARFFAALAQDDLDTRPQELRRAHRDLLQLEHAGDFRLHELYDRLQGSEQAVRMPVGLQYRIGILTRVIRKSVIFGFTSFTADGNEELKAGARTLAALCDQLAAGQHLDHVALADVSRGPFEEIFRELRQYREVSVAAVDVAGRQSAGRRRLRHFRFFQPGAFEQSEPVLYALKLTLSVLICYILYNAVAWPGITTCVVTVLFTGLSSTGAMKQKQLYRFAGAVVGGVLGILTVSLLFPNMDSVTSLVVVLAPVVFLSGWVMRSPRIGYVGVQIGFAFFLSTLQGFGPPTQLNPARDRVIGIALGIGVMWFVFDQLWPVRTSDALGSMLRKIKGATSRLRALVLQADAAELAAGEFQRLRSIVSVELTNMQQMDFAAQFEIGRHRKRELVRSRRLLREIEGAAAEFYREASRISA
ncbi:FUSC family protein [Terriglobus sp. 2YAB30_2]|uniref:FUSC family protein n=1 Tax=Terriglobus sp. 2YAB30_2 TaxID=3233023 RepID=UPI003F97143B